MASILDRYGIKEVADVTFYAIKEDGTPGKPVLYLDTLKMSSIEQTAETSDARGGKGNPKLISWDYGKEINVSIEDALFSSKSLAIMFGDGNVAFNKEDTIQRTVMVRATEGGKLPDYFVADIRKKGAEGATREKIYMGSGNTPSGMVAFSASGINLVSVTGEDGTVYQPSEPGDNFEQGEWKDVTLTGGAKAFITYTVAADTKTITVSGDSFPGTYYITGDTYARSDVTGADQFFQFIIKKAKVTSENTITLEAEGDPSVFNMSLTVLRPDDGVMMELVQYDLKAQ